MGAQTVAGIGDQTWRAEAVHRHVLSPAGAIEGHSFDVNHAGSVHQHGKENDRDFGTEPEPECNTPSMALVESD